MKTTNSSGISGKLFAIGIVAVFGLFLTTELNAQLPVEVKLGEFLFTTGPDQAKATSVVNGLTITDIYTNNTTGQLNISYADGYLNTSGWAAAADYDAALLNGRKFSFTLTKNSEIIGFKISKIVMTYKRVQSVNRGMSIYYGSNYEEVGSQFTKRSNKPADFTTYDFTDGLNSDPERAPCVISNTDELFISVSTISGNISETVPFENIEIWGYIDFIETFGRYDTYALTQPPGETNKIPDNLPLSLTSGWTTSSNIHAFNATEYVAAGNLANTETDSAYLTTPALKLDKAYEVEYNYRVRNQTIDGVLHDPAIIKVYTDNQIIDLKENITSSVIANNKSTTNAFIADADSKITFVSPMGFNADCVIDNIVVRYSTQPALNYALQSAKALGTAAKSSSKVFTIPLKAANLTGDVTLALQSGTNFTLSGGTVAQATAEAGTDVEITFNAPETVGTYTDVLTISAAGTTDRVVTLSAISDLGTSTIKLTDGSVIVTGNQLNINGHAGKKASIYNLSGATLFVQDNISDNALFTLPTKGVYLLKLEGNNSFPATTKVIIR